MLVGLVWVILTSAFQRLLLYEDVYGFTSLRMYTHIFIPWLGFLLLATIVLQILRREQYFGALLLLTTFGFALTFGIMNIDGLIVRQNVARARSGDVAGAVDAFETLLGYANDLGLFAEEVDPESGAPLGNFPQGFTHIGLINAAVTLEQVQGRHVTPQVPRQARGERKRV